MSAVFRERFAATGSYKVQEAEAVSETNVPSMRSTVPAAVQFLDDTSYTFYVDKHAKGQGLLDLVADHLDLVEPDYFGLQFIDPDFETTSDGWRWLESHKSIKKQVRTGVPYLFIFRVKFFVSDPCLLHDEYTRYNYFLQLKRDIQEGKLSVPESIAVLLASYVVQSELGDFSSEDHRPGYLSSYTFIPHQPPNFHAKVHELHKLHRGQTPADAEFNFLDQCKRLETYGISLYNARDANGVDIQLGVTFSGLVVFQNGMRLSIFAWAKIVKISFKQKQFFIQIHEETKDYDTLLGFYMLSYRTCKNLWKSCVEHHSFFRLKSTRPVISKKFSFFSFGSKFRYSGRTEYETLEEGKRRFRVEKSSITRAPSKRYQRRTVAGTSRDQILEEKPIVPGFSAGLAKDKSVATSQSQNTVNRSNSSSNIISTGNNVTIVHVSHPGSVPVENNTLAHRRSLGLSGSTSVTGNNGIPAVVAPVAVFSQHSTKRSSPGINRTKVDDDGGFRDGNFNRTTAGAKFASNHLRLDGNETSPHHAVNGLSYRVMPERSLETVSPPASLVTSNSNRSLPPPRKELILQPSVIEINGNGVGSSGLVCIRIRPDVDGKFGFNVRGGTDLNLPVIVTRVAPNTPADLAVPRLYEGDQVVSINGQDTSILTHDEVVRLIKSSYQNRSGELILFVKPNVYNGGEEADEPEFQYVPDTPKANGLLSSSPLQESMMLLAESIKNGSGLMQFEQLYKRNPKMSMKDAETLNNNTRNRYKDVLPYDSTRVLIHGVPGNDYINANYIKMEVPMSGIVNRYIAAQGPLQHTTCDFWQMVWEQQSTLIVMLTCLKEQDRIKCHMYWPKLYESANYGMLQVTCVNEEEQDCFAFRELTLIHMETNEERHITHMQYIAWPDHGVPVDASDFVEFVIRVRQYRVGMNEPCIIHCSAGIGRTGVIILMETAMCLTEANEPVYPLEIVRCMRDQRAMLVQTTSQYKFVCDAILSVYNGGLVKPLDEYRR